MTWTMEQKRKYAQDMRENMTPAEKVLWSHINRSQLGYRFIRQGLVWGFIPDFYCQKARLVIEVDGSVHDLKSEQDRIKDQALGEYGITVMRLTNEEVLTRLPMVLDNIRRECKFQTEGVLKAFSSSSVLNERTNKERLRMGCESPRNPGNSRPLNFLARKPTVQKLCPQVDDKKPATIEDWREIAKKLALLYRRKSVNLYIPPAAQQAWEQKLRLAEYAKRREQASAVPAEISKTTEAGATPAQADPVSPASPLQRCQEAEGTNGQDSGEESKAF